MFFGVWNAGQLENEMQVISSPELSASPAGSSGLSWGCSVVDRSLIRTAEMFAYGKSKAFVPRFKRCVLLMWESAAESSEHHQDVLAVLENAIRQMESDAVPTRKQLTFFRKLLDWLDCTSLISEDVTVARRYARQCGFGEWACLEGGEPSRE